jgi:hypothetical protein
MLSTILFAPQEVPMSAPLEERVAKIEARAEYTVEKIDKIESQVSDLHKAIMEGRAVKMAITIVIGFTTFVTGLAATLATIFGWYPGGK